MSGLAEYVIRLGDNALVLGQRLAALTGHAPIVEEDLASANVALDLIGQARLWLTLAGEFEGRGRDEDALAYFRNAHEFHNVLLVEQPETDYAHTIARSFLFDAWHYYVLDALRSSKDERIAAIAGKAVREVAYHVRRSSEWVVRLGDGTPESHRRIQVALDTLWPYTGELFTPDAVDTEMAQLRIGAPLDALREPWNAHVAATVADASLILPAQGWMQSGGKAGHHSEAFSYLIAEMQSVRRSVPGERW